MRPFARKVDKKERMSSSRVTVERRIFDNHRVQEWRPRTKSSSVSPVSATPGASKIVSEMVQQVSLAPGSLEPITSATRSVSVAPRVPKVQQGELFAR